MDSLKVNVMIRALELGSMSAAADELGYTTSGVSQMITAIENELGFTLVTRSRGGISLTPAGEKIYPSLLAYSHADANLRQSASEVLGLETGQIVIGSFSSIASNWLPPVIKRFREDYPDISISLIEGIHDEIDEWMKSEQIDFCMYSYRESMDLEWIPLYEDALYAVVSPDHPFAGRESISPDELNGVPFIMPGRGNDLDVVDLLRRYNVHPDIQYSTLENYSAISMVEAGLGVSVMNELITEGRLNHVILVPFDPPQTISLGIAVQNMKDLSPAARKFIENIQEYVAAL